jgi:hypothetical protein
MTDYTKATNFATKDALVTGDPLKVVKGTEIDDEFNAIEDSIETKANLASPTFTGVPKAPTAAAGTNTTQLATTAFVKTQVAADIAAIDLTNSIGADEIIDNSVGADELNVSGDGTAGQFLISDGDGSFSWTAISVLSPAASDPTTRDDGTSLAEGDQYYNTTDDGIKTYDGSAWSQLGGNTPVPIGTIDTSNTIGEATIAASMSNGSTTFASQDFIYYGEDVTSATLKAAVTGSGNVTVKIAVNGTEILNSSAGGGNHSATVVTDLDNGDTVTFYWRDWDSGSNGTFSVLCANPYAAGCGWTID